MPKNRDELTKLLDKLEAKLPEIIKDHPDDGDFWCAFAGEAEIIEDSAGKDDCQFVHSRIDCMLGAQGLNPSENEGQSCA